MYDPNSLGTLGQKLYSLINNRKLWHIQLLKQGLFWQQGRQIYWRSHIFEFFKQSNCSKQLVNKRCCFCGIRTVWSIFQHLLPCCHQQIVSISNKIVILHHTVNLPKASDRINWLYSGVSSSKTRCGSLHGTPVCFLHWSVHWRYQQSVKNRKKDASKQWFDLLTKILTDSVCRFKQSAVNPCVFFRPILVHVDGCLIFGKDKSVADKFA